MRFNYKLNATNLGILPILSNVNIRGQHSNTVRKQLTQSKSTDKLTLLDDLESGSVNKEQKLTTREKV